MRTPIVCNHQQQPRKIKSKKAIYSNIKIVNQTQIVTKKRGRPPKQPPALVNNTPFEDEETQTYSLRKKRKME